MLVSGFPGSGYLSAAASPMLVVLCTCVFVEIEFSHEDREFLKRDFYKLHKGKSD